MSVSEVDGWSLPATSVSVLDNIKTRDVKLQDIILISHPKSGAKWMQEILSIILQGSTAEDVSKKWVNLDKISTSAGSAATTDQGQATLIRTHLPWAFIPPKATSTESHAGCKLIYVLRNPKDVMAGMYFRHPHGQKVHGTFEAFVKDFTAGKTPFGPYFQHLKEFWTRSSHRNLMIVSYESLYKDPLSVATQLCAFLKVSVDQATIKKIQHFAEAKQMKGQGAETHYADVFPDGRLNQDNPTPISVGEIGLWKQHFTKDIDQLVDAWIGYNMANSELKGLVFQYE